MLYRHKLYLVLIILAEIFIYFVLAYGYFHSENHFQILGLSNLNQYETALISFNTIIFLIHVVIAVFSIKYIKSNKKTLPLMFVAVINLIIAIWFLIVGIYDNLINVQEVNIFKELRLITPYADIYYVLPVLWAVLYFIFIYSKISNKSNRQ